MMSPFGTLSGHTNGRCECPLLTQSGQAGLAVDGNEGRENF
jgi:hypothetical protein